MQVQMNSEGRAEPIRVAEPMYTYSEYSAGEIRSR
jgi:hypothetical protein